MILDYAELEPVIGDQEQHIESWRYKPEHRDENGKQRVITKLCDHPDRLEYVSSEGDHHKVPVEFVNQEGQL